MGHSGSSFGDCSPTSDDDESGGYPTTTTLYVSAGPLYSGQPVTLTAMVVGSDPQGDIATGNVNWFNRHCATTAHRPCYLY